MTSSSGDKLLLLIKGVSRSFRTWRIVCSHMNLPIGDGQSHPKGQGHRQQFGPWWKKMSASPSPSLVMWLASQPACCRHPLWLPSCPASLITLPASQGWLGCFNPPQSAASPLNQRQSCPAQLSLWGYHSAGETQLCQPQPHESFLNGFPFSSRGSLLQPGPGLHHICPIWQPCRYIPCPQPMPCPPTHCLPHFPCTHSSSHRTGTFPTSTLGWHTDIDIWATGSKVGVKGPELPFPTPTWLPIFDCKCVGWDWECGRSWARGKLHTEICLSDLFLPPLSQKSRRKASFFPNAICTCVEAMG